MRRSPSARETVAALMDRGCSSFLAYQIMQDMRWVSGPYDDEDSWALVGPGALRGLQRLADSYEGHRTWQDRRHDSPILKTTHMPRELRDAMLPLVAELRARLGPRISMHEVEHNLCEWDKYCRISTGESRGRRFEPRS